MHVAAYVPKSDPFHHFLLCSISDTKGAFFFKNQSNDAYTSGDITAPSGTTLLGNCAESIVERPGLSGVPQKLAKYGTDYFDTSFASSSAGDLLASGTGTLLNMTDDSGKTISKASVAGPEYIKCT